MQDNDENQPDYPFNSFFNDFMPISFQEANLPVLPPENPLDVQFDMCSPTNTNDLSESHSSSFSFVQETCENTDSSSLNTDHSSPEFSFLLNQSQKTISQFKIFLKKILEFLVQCCFIVSLFKNKHSDSYLEIT